MHRCAGSAWGKSAVAFSLTASRSTPNAAALVSANYRKKGSRLQPAARLRPTPSMPNKPRHAAY
eukprot:916525-Pyramimonas_sp.AAC.1